MWDDRSFSTESFSPESFWFVYGFSLRGLDKKESISATQYFLSPSGTLSLDGRIGTVLFDSEPITEIFTAKFGSVNRGSRSITTIVGGRSETVVLGERGDSDLLDSLSVTDEQLSPSSSEDTSTRSITLNRGVK